MSDDLDATPSLTGDPLLDLWPIFVPDSFFQEGSWPGPFDHCAIPNLGLTWAVLAPSGMAYLTLEQAREWEEQGIRWRDQALENVLAIATRVPYTHEFHDAAGRIYAVALMPEDGVGPSRLLANQQFEKLFPEGYLIGLPEMSCALVISLTATPEHHENIVDIVRRCFSNGTRPLVPGLHAPGLLRPRPSPR